MTFSSPWFAPLLVLFLTPALLCSADLTPPVKVESGLLQGVTNADQDVVSYLGVPYAAPPVGALRWREPQPPLPWSGVRLADKFGACCPQMQFGTKTLAPNSNEDCLFMNIWVPAKTTEKNLPILFFVHGGMYQFGSGDFQGEGMAKKGIILITVNVRLGNFCSEGHPELTKESPLHSCANYGSLDLIAALKWIQTNIAAFGGDPTKVTISGQSTGANNVHYLTTSPMAKGLFRGIIAISFPYDFLMKPQAIGNMNQAENGGLALAKSRKLKTLEELRQIPAAELVGGGGGPTYASPVYPKNYPSSLKEGLVNDVPTLTGLTVDDFTPPAKYDPYTDLTFFKKRMLRKWPTQGDDALALYPAKTNDEAKEMWKQVGVDQLLANTYHWATLRAKTAKTPTYTYLFTQAQPQHPEKGACHGSDLDYEFNNVRDPEKHWRDEDRKVAEQVSSYWVNFVKTGNPNGPGLPEWKAVDPNTPATMHLGKECGMHDIGPNGRWKLYPDPFSK